MIDDTESTNLPELRPLSFGEIYSSAWSLLPRTLPNAGLMALLIMVPFTWVNWLQQKSLMLDFVEIMPRLNSSSNSAPPELIAMMGSILGMVGLNLLGGLLIVWLLNAMVTAAWGGYNGHTVGIGSMLREAGGKRYWYSVVQFFIVFAILFMAYIVFIVLFLLVSLVFAPLGIILFPLFFAAALYFMGLIVLSRHQIMLEGRGPWRGLIASMSLIKGNWWKTIALCILLIVPFMLLSSAVYFPMVQDIAAFVKSHPEFVKAMSPAVGTQPDQTVIASFYKMLANTIPGWIFPILGAIQAISLVVLNNGLTALYVDLRTRRGDFNEIMDEDNMPL
jgi:hypothetical protein